MQTGSTDPGRVVGRSSKVISADPYFKKIIKYPYRGQMLDLRVSQELFSSQAVDTGTQRLMRSILDPRFDSLTRVLDLGCGYGPVGLTLSKLSSDRLVHLVDRDALAVSYSLENARLARLSNVEIYGSLGYSDVTEDSFDLIISNIPAKAGEPVITDFLCSAADHLNDNGLVAVVVVSPLDPSIERILSRPDIEIVLKKAWPGHTVFHYRFLNTTYGERRGRTNELNMDVYERDRMKVVLPSLDYSMRTVYGLQEFDSLNFRTELALAVVMRQNMSNVLRVATHNVGQGHVAVGLWRIFHPNRVELVDRDLLSLRVTKLNLIENGCSDNQIGVSHQVGMKQGEARDLDLVVLMLDDEELGVHRSIAVDAICQTSEGGTIVIASRVASIMRLEAAL